METDKLSTELKSTTLFFEDILAETLKPPSGLQNLGNTGYLNSTLQFLRAIPELQESLNKFTGESSDSDHLTASLRDLYRNLNQTTESYAPLSFLRILRNIFPQFAQRNAHGFMQQDAQECWTQIVNSLKQSNISISYQTNLSSNVESSSSSLEGSFIDRYMTGEFTSTLKCLDAPEEGEALDERVEKNSPTLGRMADYSKISCISRLPSYLTVQFVRFFWKAEQCVFSKILHKVNFPIELDVTDFCTDELKNKILPLKHLDSINDEEKLKPFINPDLDKDIGANISGLYELCAILAHLGRSADFGHYIGCVRKEDSEDWIQYDDDKVSIMSQEEIKELYGGGECTAYMLLYRSKKIA
ncbi:hypothetical protein C1645_829951 [Glomus cerebriforme]|uniref:ubiquitinyl hydrolase 1 n=1 Tax=Glomus cerebriforme TaxID=658196 RepID=A0A397SPL8_9GLOM|nr:hypothetical protein C1645_829951 [Glomus cerebriforme]